MSTKNDFGLDVGGGVMGFFSDNVGLRGDIRYFRGFRGTSDNDSLTRDARERLQVLARGSDRPLSFKFM